FSFSSSAPPPHLPSFPTRRSSDLPFVHRLKPPFPLLRYTASVPPLPEPISKSSHPSPSRSLQATPGPNWLSFLGNNGCRSKSSRSEEHTSELQSRGHLVCRLLLEK